MSILLFELGRRRYNGELWATFTNAMGSYSSLGAGRAGQSGRLIARRSASPRPARRPPPVRTGNSSRRLTGRDSRGRCRRTAELGAGERLSRRLPLDRRPAAPAAVERERQKRLKSAETLRIQQQVIESPRYEVAVRLSAPEASRVAEALLTPASVVSRRFVLPRGGAQCESGGDASGFAGLGVSRRQRGGGGKRAVFAAHCQRRPVL